VETNESRTGPGVQSQNNESLWIMDQEQGVGVGSEQQDKCRTPSTEKEHTHTSSRTRTGVQSSCTLYTEGTHQNTNSMRNILLPSPIPRHDRH